VSTDYLEKRLDEAEDDIKQLTRNVTILTRDVQAMLKIQEEIASLIKDQALHAKDIEQTRDIAELALSRTDELRADVAEMKTKVAVSEAVKTARLGMLQVFARYWPLWITLAALGIAGTLIIRNITV
jgi:uncharacterized protein YqfA (UPF0365 family)